MDNGFFYVADDCQYRFQKFKLAFWILNNNYHLLNTKVLIEL